MICGIVIPLLNFEEDEPLQRFCNWKLGIVKLQAFFVVNAGLINFLFRLKKQSLQVQKIRRVFRFPPYLFLQFLYIKRGFLFWGQDKATVC